MADESRSQEPSEAVNPKDRSYWMEFAVLLVFLPVLLWAMTSRDYVLAVSWCCVVFCGFKGMRSGAAGMIGMIAAIAIALALAPSIGMSYEGEAAKWLGTTGLTNRILSISLAGIIMAVVLSLIAKQITRQWSLRSTTFARLNRLSGVILGFLQGATLVLLFLGGVVTIEGLQRSDSYPIYHPSSESRSTLLVKLVDQTRSSRLGPWVEKYNPYERIPQLNRFAELKQSVSMIAEPAKMQRLLDHPEVKRLRNDAQTQQVMQELVQDPDINRILHSGKPIDVRALVVLMNHPSVLKLIDQPGFLESASKVLREARGETQGTGN
ncbi:MAG: hypothetical protein RLY14_1494 [Planctomycetota bacterium]